MEIHVAVNSKFVQNINTVTVNADLEYWTNGKTELVDSLTIDANVKKDDYHNSLSGLAGSILVERSHDKDDVLEATYVHADQTAMDSWLAGATVPFVPELQIEGP